MYLFIFTFNHEKYIEKCLRSAIFQTEKFDKIIVIDDKSTDSTIDIIKFFKKNHKNVYLYENKVKHFHENANFIYSFIKSKQNNNLFFSIISGDDKLEIDFVSTVKKYIFKNSKIKFFFSSVHIINSNDEYISSANSFLSDKLFKKNSYLLENIYYKRKINSVSFVFNSNEVFKNQLLIQNKNSSYDYETLINISSKYDVVYISKFLAYWRRHITQESFNKRIPQYKFDYNIFNKYKKLVDDIKLFNKYKNINYNFRFYLLAMYFYNKRKTYKFYKYSFFYLFKGRSQLLNLLIILICLFSYPFSNKLHNKIRKWYLFN